ncbi:MAG: alpha/beta fold hydrolase [Candidatus Kapaibacterium sp.]
MKQLAGLIFCILVITGAAGLKAQNESAAEVAREFIEKLREAKYEDAYGMFNRKMKEAMALEQLSSMWSQINSQTGGFKDYLDFEIETTGELVIINQGLEFEAIKLNARVTVNKEEKISGLYLMPYQSDAAWSKPEYADTTKFREKEIEFGLENQKLPGTLTIPAGNGPFPVLILVHGSGSHDRDETIGPNKPFKDLAWGLASNGIAVFRYVKRTHRYKEQFMGEQRNITINEETVYDAVEAVNKLKEFEELDSKRIFLLGHSLGGYIMPRIARLQDRAAGYIIMAGNMRPLEDLVIDQVQYIAELDGLLSDEETKQINVMKKQVDRLAKEDFDEDTPATELPMGIPAVYWMDLINYDPAEMAKDIDEPILILQGERDYQVTTVDYNLWREAIGGRDNVKMILYPKLNHLFMEGEGDSRPSEYNEAGNISPKVIRDISEWVKSI